MLRVDRLRAVREMRGISQNELARISGVAQNQISRYEAGQTDPSSTTLGRIALALDVSTDYLLGLSDLPFSSTPQDLSAENRRLVEAFELGDHATVLELVTMRMRATDMENVRSTS